MAPGVSVTLLDRCVAFSSRTARPHAFSHATAALLHGMPLPETLESGPLHVMFEPSARATRAMGTIGHSATLRIDDTVALQGIYVTNVERTWCDLASILGFADLVAAGDSLLWHKNPATTRERLRETVAQYPSQRGRVRMRAALEALSDRSRSRPETLVRLALVASHLPNPEPNYGVRLEISGRNIEIDLAYPEYLIGLEYQGDHHRTDRRQWRNDVRRGNDAVDENWSMVYFTGDDLVDLDNVIVRTERRFRMRGWPGPPSIPSAGGSAGSRRR
ncbi:hypothetical protein L1277_001735 [Okibacterium sp. HSC-33S16]|uniref:hypothetical protein n=1 Tax=Okibacterium sp. HSC-33S16 TaxID=2910965 RepID=UPI0020A0C95A|nr:hypothetical protein [Okibacterium sp. HSC-33S16]MCP2031637.1 hypothetical protein [Okibacterium sp. HSC-33S16]